MEKILEDINRIALRFLAPHNPEEMYRIIVEEGRKLINADSGSIFLDKNGELQRVYASEDALYKVKARKKGFVYKAYSLHTPFILSIDQVKHLYPRMVSIGIKSIIVVPLSYKNDSIGVMTMQSKKEKHFSKNELNILQLFGSLASMAIRKTELYDQTKKALETRDLFISLASHELRTPLTSLNGYIQLLYSKLSKKDTIEAKWIKELYEESTRLTNLVKELLEINRIKQGQLQYNLQECTPADFVDIAIHRYSFINSERKIIFIDQRSNKNSKVIGDPEKLLQMFTALLKNADKFSPKTDPIEVILKNTQSQLIILVKDSGDGVPRQDINRVFEGFYKSGEKTTEGLGVGLLLSKHIIQYHHGSISMRSKIKKGTTVEVRLPLLRQ